MLGDVLELSLNPEQVRCEEEEMMQVIKSDATEKQNRFLPLLRQPASLSEMGPSCQSVLQALHLKVDRTHSWPSC